MSEKPRTAWDAISTPYELGVVWLSRLDGLYQVEVWRDPLNTHKGKLLVWDKQGEGDLLLEQEVTLSYGAMYGPDVDDVASWQNQVMELIDNQGR